MYSRTLLLLRNGKEKYKAYKYCDKKLLNKLVYELFIKRKHTNIEVWTGFDAVTPPIIENNGNVEEKLKIESNINMLH